MINKAQCFANKIQLYFWKRRRKYYYQLIYDSNIVTTDEDHNEYIKTFDKIESLKSCQ